MKKAININICIISVNNDEESIQTVFESFTNHLTTNCSYQNGEYTKNNKIKLEENNLIYDCRSYTNNKSNISFYNFKTLQQSHLDETAQIKKIQREIDIKLKAISKVFEIHLIVIFAGNKSMISHMNIILTEYDTCSFILLPNDLKEDSDSYSSKSNKYLMNDQEDFNQGLYSKITEIIQEFPNYYLFEYYSKERHYDTFTSYYLRKQYLKSLSTFEQIELFNSFEQFSFDGIDNADDCLILIELFSINENKMSMNLNRNKCEGCMKDQIICCYFKEKGKYYCEKCIGLLNPDLVKKKGIRCSQCKGEFDQCLMDTFMQVSCCEKKFCILCLKIQIKANEEESIKQHDLSLLTCFCGIPFEEKFIKEIISNESYKEIFDFEIVQSNDEVEYFSY